MVVLLVFLSWVVNLKRSFVGLFPYGYFQSSKDCHDSPTLVRLFDLYLVEAFLFTYYVLFNIFSGRAYQSSIRFHIACGCGCIELGNAALGGNLNLQQSFPANPSGQNVLKMSTIY